MSEHDVHASPMPIPGATPGAGPATPVRVWRDGNAGAFLTVPQHAAFAALTEGKTIRECAQAAGVHRNTVAQWLRRDPVFRAAYNGWCREMIDSARAKVLGLADAAAAAVAAAVARGDTRIALSILRDMGLTRADAATGPTHPGIIREQLNKQDERRDRRVYDLREHRDFPYLSVRKDLQRRLAEPSPEAPDCKQCGPEVPGDPHRTSGHDVDSDRPEAGARPADPTCLPPRQMGE